MKRREITSLLIGACILGSIVGAVPTVANATTNTETAIVKDKVAIKNNSGKIIGYTNPYDAIDVKGFNKDLCNVTTQFGLKGNVEKKDLQFIRSDLNEQFEIMNEDGHVVNVTTGLNLREKATTDSNIIGSLENNTNLKIVGKQGDWYKVSINGKEGFVYSSFIDEGKSIDNNSNKSNNEKVVPRQDLNDYYEDMKDTGNWNHVYNSGFTIGVSGFTVNSNEIKFLTDGSFTSSEEDEILKVFKKITPSAIDQIKDALDNGKDFSGTFDGLHISASFDKFGQITITNDGDLDSDSNADSKGNTQVDTNKDNKAEEKQETKDTVKEDTQNTKSSTSKDIKDNTEVDNKNVDAKAEEKQETKDTVKETTKNDKVDANKDAKDSNKVDDKQNSNIEDKQNVKEDSNEKQANQKANQQESENNSLDSKKNVQADDKVANKDAKQNIKSDDNQNVQQDTQIDNSKLLADNKGLEAQTK